MKISENHTLYDDNHAHEDNNDDDDDDDDGDDDDNDVQNINHKGLQRTASEYAEERRICKDLISKNDKVDILNSASRNTAMLIVL